jgi:hypothetical protein
LKVYLRTKNANDGNCRRHVERAFALYNLG